MSEILHREFVYLWYYFSVQFELIFRYWLIGIIAGSLISVFGKKGIYHLFSALQNKKLGFFGVVPACLLGIASPLCMYGTIPIAGSFSQGGMRDDWLAAFMMGSILLNPQLLIYSAVLGKTAFFIRLVLAVLCGSLAGIFVRVFYTGKDSNFFDFSHLNSCANKDIDPNILLRFLKNIYRNIKATGPYFLLGILLTACFQRYIPEDQVVRFFGNNEAFGVLMAAALGVPLYICGGGTIPLLQEWLTKGMSLGSAGAFMITGPATKLTNLSALKIVLGTRRFGLYIIFSSGYALISGIVIDLLF